MIIVPHMKVQAVVLIIYNRLAIVQKEEQRMAAGTVFIGERRTKRGEMAIARLVVVVVVPL